MFVTFNAYINIVLVRDQPKAFQSCAEISPADLSPFFPINGCDLRVQSANLSNQILLLLHASAVVTFLTDGFKLQSSSLKHMMFFTFNLQKLQSLPLSIE